MIEFKNVCLKYVKDYFALYDVNFQFEKGNVYNVVGQNASGKSSLLRCIANLEKDYNGEILYNEKEIRTYDFSCDISVGYVPMQPVVLEKQTLEQNLCFAIKNRDIVEEEEKNYYIDRLLNGFNLNKFKNTKIKKLSYFDKQKFALARMSMRDIDILLIDNVFDQLSKEEIENFINYVKEFLIKENNITIIASSFALTDYFDNLKVVYINAGMIKIDEQSDDIEENKITQHSEEVNN